MKILLIGDNANYLIFLKYLLKKFHNQIITLTNPQNAFELIKQKDFNLIIIDIDISMINGIQFYYKIRKTTKNTVVILNTLVLDFDKKIEALKRGINRFYSKSKKNTHTQKIEFLKRFNNFDRIKEL